MAGNGCQMAGNGCQMAEEVASEPTQYAALCDRCGMVMHAIWGLEPTKDAILVLCRVCEARRWYRNPKAIGRAVRP